MFDTIRRFNQRRAVRRELNSLTDLQLSDIGISRCDIPYIANGQFKRKN